jgi:hypothetical protein
MQRYWARIPQVQRDLACKRYPALRKLVSARSENS